MVSALDPDVVAEVNARIALRTAHHEAGHAVAAVVRGGTVLDVRMGQVDWSDHSGDSDRPGFVKHITRRDGHPFVTFSGVWAEARWELETDAESGLDMSDTLESAWFNNQDGDAEKYESFVDDLEEYAAAQGFTSIGLAWERDWGAELDALYPAIVAVAEELHVHGSVSHDFIAAAIAEHANADEKG